MCFHIYRRGHVLGHHDCTACWELDLEAGRISEYQAKEPGDACDLCTPTENE